MGRIIGLIVNPPKAFACPVCGKEFKTETGLKNHIEKEHATESQGEPQENS